MTNSDLHVHFPPCILCIHYFPDHLHVCGRQEHNKKQLDQSVSSFVCVWILEIIRSSRKFCVNVWQNCNIVWSLSLRELTFPGIMMGWRYLWNWSGSRTYSSVFCFRWTSLEPPMVYRLYIHGVLLTQNVLGSEEVHCAFWGWCMYCCMPDSRDHQFPSQCMCDQLTRYFDFWLHSWLCTSK